MLYHCGFKILSAPVQLDTPFFSEREKNLGNGYRYLILLRILGGGGSIYFTRREPIPFIVPKYSYQDWLFFGVSSVFSVTPVLPF